MRSSRVHANRFLWGSLSRKEFVTAMGFLLNAYTFRVALKRTSNNKTKHTCTYLQCAREKHRQDIVATDISLCSITITQNGFLCVWSTLYHTSLSACYVLHHGHAASWLVVPVMAPKKALQVANVPKSSSSSGRHTSSEPCSKRAKAQAKREANKNKRRELMLATGVFICCNCDKSAKDTACGRVKYRSSSTFIGIIFINSTFIDPRLIKFDTHRSKIAQVRNSYAQD